MILNYKKMLEKLIDSFNMKTKPSKTLVKLTEWKVYELEKLKNRNINRQNRIAT